MIRDARDIAAGTATTAQVRSVLHGAFDRDRRLPSMHPSNLLRRIESHVRHQLGLPLPWVRLALLGRELVLRAGTIRVETDYDDAWLYACLQHSDLVFDVGANVGQSALIALLCPRVRQVVLVEANWRALSVAAQNLVRNGLSARARFVQAFAAEASDRLVDFWTVGTGAAGSMFRGHAVTAAREGSVQRIPTVTIDELCDEFEVVPDLIKIDVEGAESKVLQGSTRCAAHHSTRFLVEMHSPPELPMARNAALVLDWAQAAGYAVWYLSAAERIETPQPIEHRGRCHLLLQPADWPYPDWLAGIKQSAPLPVV